MYANNFGVGNINIAQISRFGGVANAQIQFKPTMLANLQQKNPETVVYGFLESSFFSIEKQDKSKIFEGT